MPSSTGRPDRWCNLYDFDLAYLQDVTEFLDLRFAQLEDECCASSDPDQFGIFDRTEHLSGLAFTACQTYLEAVCVDRGVSKVTALAHGPLHPCGAYVAQLINHAANWWKHRLQWKAGQLSPQEQRTLDGLAALDLNSDYPLSEALRNLAGETFPRIAPLVEPLVDWRDALDEVMNIGDVSD